MSTRGETPTGRGKAGAPPRRPSVAAGWPRALFWLALSGGIVFLAVRSYKHSDLLAVYTRAGNVQGIESHRGRVLVALSNLSFGPEKALTADAASVSTEEGEGLYELVYKRWDRRREIAGFGFALSGKGEVVGDATHVAAVVPHWFLAALATLPAAMWAARAWRRHRRTRRTAMPLCWQCGYPLVHVTDLCPECGEAVDPTPAAGGDAAAG